MITRQTISILIICFYGFMVNAEAQGPACATAACFTARGAHAYLRESDATIDIPVVFHIVENFDSNISINKPLLLFLLAAVNKDFNASNEDIANIDPDFKNAVGNAGFVFGFPTGEETFITHHDSEHLPFGNDEIFSAEGGGGQPYKPESYLNIYVADLAEGILGWSSNPGSATQSQAIIIDYQVVTDLAAGANYRTLTHETGHFFGLSHLEGNGGCDSDDGIEDTPLQEKKITGCPSSAFSCGSADMVQNFMNLSSDECLLFFTKGQVERMRNVYSQYYSSYRNEIESPITSLHVDKPLIEIFPNPFFNQLRVSTTAGSYLSVCDAMGIILKERKLRQDNFYIDTGYWAPGTYFFNIRTDKRSYFFKLLKLNAK